MFILRALNIHRVRRVNLFLRPLVFGQLDSFHCLQDVPLLDHATRQSENVSDGWFISKLIPTPKINNFIFPRNPFTVLTFLIMFSFHFCVNFWFVWIWKQKKTSQKIWRFTGDVGFTGDSPHVNNNNQSESLETSIRRFTCQHLPVVEYCQHQLFNLLLELREQVIQVGGVFWGSGMVKEKTSWQHGTTSETKIGKTASNI